MTTRHMRFAIAFNDREGNPMIAVRYVWGWVIWPVKS